MSAADMLSVCVDQSCTCARQGSEHGFSGAHVSSHAILVSLSCCLCEITLDPRCF